MSISGEVYSGGATTSQHIEAEDEEHFQNTTFKLKRTRSIGVLDEFIPDKLKENNIETVPLVNNVSSGSQSDEEHDTTITTAPTAISNNVEPTSPLSPSPLPLLQSPDLLPHDDTDLMIEPSRHVDYLSYQWDVNDISKSWRYVISKKHNVANQARLENASWRTWAQRRQNLKTISPEVVNWSKDSDVTWLYGPILNDEHGISDDETCNYKRETTATSVVAGDISLTAKNKPLTTTPKPILKKRTVQESMISHSDLLKLQLASNKVYQKQRELIKQQQEVKQKEEVKPPETFFDYDTISAKLNKQYENANIPENCEVVKLQDLLQIRTNSKTKLNEQQEQPLVEPMENLSLEKSPEIVPEEHPKEEPVKEDRHIHFNEEVKQCIAINTYSDSDVIPEEDEDTDDDDNYYYEDDEIGDDGYYEDVSNYYYDGSKSHLYDREQEFSDVEDEDEDEDDEGGFFIKVKSNSNAPLILAKNVTNENTEDTESISTSNSKVYKTIHLLPSTSLNYGSSDEESDDENPYTSSLSHNVNNDISRGYDYYYDYNTVYTVDPNHAIYGKTPADVIDVPDNLGMGSNFDYEIIENDEMPPMVINMKSPLLYDSQPPTSPIVQVVPSPILLATNSKTPFHLSDDDDDSDDSDEGLSIGTRRSSQALAESVFQTTTPTTTTQQQQHFPEKFLKDPEPIEAPISSINPRYSSTSLSKQPTSSHSLSQSFFGGSGNPGTNMTTTSESEGLSHVFFDKRVPSPIVLSSTPDNSLTRTLSNKSSPLPPQTTSETASSKNIFSFDDESEEEEEEEEQHQHDGLFIGKKTYNSLSQVADKSGIRTPSPTIQDEKNRTVMGQAKGLAKHFFG